MTKPLQPTEADAQDQLEHIEIQRQALEQLFKITRSVENLRSGLETTLLMGKTTGHTSDRALALYQQLDAKTHDLSNDDIHMRLKRIDQKIKKHLAETIHLVENLSDQDFIDSTGDAAEVTHNMINDFKRSAQTMAALQVLLNMRGLPVAPKTFDISQKVLQEKINSINTRERRYRNRINTETIVMEQDIKRLLYADSCSEQMRPFLQHILKGLKANRQHLEEGLNIHELPYEIDQITLTDCASNVQLGGAERPSTPTAASSVDPKDKKKTAVATAPKEKKVGLLKGIIIWLNSPVDVSLKDILKK